MSIKDIHGPMTLSQDQLAAFYEVSRQKSFTKAADELGLTQSALSHRIRKLEEQLETTLFMRDPSGIRLTEPGLKLLEFCRLQSQIEDELLASLTNPFEKKIKGYLRIGGASTLLSSVVVPALADFLAQNNLVQFEFIEGELSELPEYLQTGKVDFIVTCGKIERANFEGHYLGDEVNVLVETKKSPNREDVYLDHDASDQTTFNFLKHQGMKKIKVERCFLDNINGIIAGVEAGLGKAVVPKHLIKDSKKIKVSTNQKEMKVPAYLYVLKQPFYSALHTAVVKELTKNIPHLLHS